MTLPHFLQVMQANSRVGVDSLKMMYDKKCHNKISSFLTELLNKQVHFLRQHVQTCTIYISLKRTQFTSIRIEFYRALSTLLTDSPATGKSATRCWRNIARILRCPLQASQYKNYMQCVHRKQSRLVFSTASSNCICRSLPMIMSSTSPA